MNIGFNPKPDDKDIVRSDYLWLSLHELHYCATFFYRNEWREELKRLDKHLKHVGNKRLQFTSEETATWQRIFDAAMQEKVHERLKEHLTAILEFWDAYKMGG